MAEKSGRMADALGIDKEIPEKYERRKTLIQYFLDRLKEQTEAHHGGHKWIGTGGNVTHGNTPAFIPEACVSAGSRETIQPSRVAMERRYKDYSQEGH